MDFNELVAKAKDKNIGQNTVSDFVMFKMMNPDGTEREVMKSEVDNYFSKRGRKTDDDRLIFKGYQDYLIDQTDFTVADLNTNNLGYVTYKNGQKLPVVVQINNYKFTESAISYYSTFKERTAAQEVAVMIGKLFEMVNLDEDETIDEIRRRLKRNKQFMHLA